MKKINFRILALLLAVLTAGAVGAQQMERQMNITIPFDFVVGDKPLPAGEYNVLGGSSHNFIWLKSADCRNVAVTSTIYSSNKDLAEKSLLQFRRYGDSYFLSKVVVAGESTSKTLGQSKREREVALIAARAGIATVQAAQNIAK